MADLYNSLPLGEHHIRILQLAKDPSGEVHATMQVVDLDAEPDQRDYTCFSYTWGPPTWDDTDESWYKTDRHSININACSMPVRPNLRNAMNHLYDKLDGKPIWIDAICINQNNETERSAQVQMMARIYEQASKVVVWLGESSPISKTAIENMDRFPLLLEMTRKDVPRGPKIPTLPETFEIAHRVCQLEDHEKVEIVKFLTGNTWFSRVWTSQEWILAKKVEFLCGDDKAELETIWRGSALSSLGSVPGASHLDGPRRDWVRHFSCSVCIQNLASAKTEKLSIGVNADLYRHLEAADRRDKVFGLLGISQTEGNHVHEPFLVDYGLSTQNVFTKTAAYGLLVEQDLHYLSSVGDRTQNEVEDLPSWVPDFTQQVPWTSFSSPGQGYFKATSEPAAISLDLNQTSALGLEAYRIDSVFSICDASWGDADGHEPFEMRIASFFRFLAQPPAPVTCYDEDLASVILRLVLADGFRRRMDPRQDPEVVETFDEWVLNGFPFEEADQARQGVPDSVKDLWVEAASQIPRMAEEATAIQEPLLKDLHPIAESAEKLKKILGKSEEEKDLGQDHFSEQWRATCKSRCFFRTDSGYVGVGPRTINVGDQVMLLKGGQVPYVLRRQCMEPETAFNFVGEAYLHGFMFGEGLQRPDFEWTGISIY